HLSTPAHTHRPSPLVTSLPHRPLPVGTTQLSTVTPDPWLNQSQGPLPQSTSAQKSKSLLVLIAKKHQRPRALESSLGSQRTSCWRTLNR
ncbi:unnamed protein product, partial [Gulo gulo]